MDRILFGDNQFFGINHMSEEKARAQAMRFGDIREIIDLLDAVHRRHRQAKGFDQRQNRRLAEGGALRSIGVVKLHGRRSVLEDFGFLARADERTQRRIVRHVQIGSFAAAVAASPVFGVPVGSMSRRCTSSFATGRCSTPLGTM